VKNRAWVDYSHIAENAARIMKFSGKKIFAVVKNDAYNLGLAEVVGSLLEGGTDHFAVASMEEALFIKGKFPGAYVLQFNPADRAEIDLARDRRVALSVAGERWFYDNADFLTGVDLHLKINVGMNRFGISDLDASERVVRDCAARGLSLVGLFTHLPLAEESDLSGHERQVGLFRDFYERLSPLREFQFIHAENTGATLLRDSRLSFCNYVRPGAMLWGCSTREQVDWLLPAVYVMSLVIELRDVPRGGRLGYGYDFSAERDMRIAVLPIGYGDGLIRARRAEPVLIGGTEYGIAGKIFLSHTFVEVDDRVKIGDDAEIYGERIKIDALTSKGIATNAEQMIVARLLRSRPL
jgi:alanine racemase